MSLLPVQSFSIRPSGAAARAVVSLVGRALEAIAASARARELHRGIGFPGRKFPHPGARAVQSASGEARTACARLGEPVAP